MSTWTWLVAAATAAVLVPISASAQDICAAEWSLSETLRIGSVDGEVVLTGAQGLEIGPDGDVYLTQPLVTHISVFDSTGRLARTIGRGGEGPGELQLGAAGSGSLGDTLWVTDMYRMHLFRWDGSFIETVSFRTAIPSEGSILLPGTLLADGTLLSRRLSTDHSRFATASDDLPILRLSRDGEILDTLAPCPGPNAMYR